MERLVAWFARERNRAYLYRVTVAVIAVLVGAGLLGGITADQILFLIGALLGVGGGTLASANTTTKE